MHGMLYRLSRLPGQRTRRVRLWSRGRVLARGTSFLRLSSPQTLVRIRSGFLR